MSEHSIRWHRAQLKDHPFDLRIRQMWAVELAIPVVWESLFLGTLKSPLFEATFTLLVEDDTQILASLEGQARTFKLEDQLWRGYRLKIISVLTSSLNVGMPKKEG